MPPPSESSITGEIPPLGGSIYRCSANIVDLKGLCPARPCGAELIWVDIQPLHANDHKPRGRYRHVDERLDVDHAPQRPRPLRGVEQPRWLDSRQHRTLLVYVAILVALILMTLVRDGLRETLILVGIVAFFSGLFVLGAWWSQRAPRP